MRSIGLTGVDGATLSEGCEVIAELVGEVVRPPLGPVVELDVDDMVGTLVRDFNDPYRVAC